MIIFQNPKIIESKNCRQNYLVKYYDLEKNEKNNFLCPLWVIRRRLLFLCGHLTADCRQIIEKHFLSAKINWLFFGLIFKRF